MHADETPGQCEGVHRRIAQGEEFTTELGWDPPLPAEKVSALVSLRYGTGAGVGIQYAEEQEPLAESDEQAIRKLVYDIALEEVPVAKQLGAREAGSCTLKMGVHLAALAFPRPGFTGPRNRGAAVVIFEFRDSLTNEPLVRYGQRRELTNATRKTDGGPDVERLTEILHDVLADVRTAMRDSLPVNRTGARAAEGCHGVIGDVRTKARAR